MPKSFYIIERHNPQLGVYYIKAGQLTKKDAKARGNSIYGTNVMLEYPSEAEYNEAIEKLKKEGNRLQ